MSERIDRILLVMIATSCAVVQAWILRHELVHSLPFKTMLEAPDYRSVADLAAYVGPGATLAAALAVTWWQSGLRRATTLTLTSAVVCPIAFAVLFRLLTAVPATNPDTPDFSTEAAWHSFVLWATKVSVAGCICAGVLIASTNHFSKRRQARGA